MGIIKRFLGGYRNSVFFNFLGMVNVSGFINLRVSSFLDNSVDESLGFIFKVDGKEEEDDGKYVSKYFRVIRFSIYILINLFSWRINEGNLFYFDCGFFECFYIDFLMKM